MIKNEIIENAEDILGIDYDKEQEVEMLYSIIEKLINKYYDLQQAYDNYIDYVNENYNYKSLQEIYGIDENDFH